MELHLVVDRPDVESVNVLLKNGVVSPGVNLTCDLGVIRIKG